MTAVYLQLSSVTYAYNAKSRLESHGMTAYMQRIPKHLSDDGCGYVIKIKEADANRAMAILNDNGIKIKKVYYS